MPESYNAEKSLQKRSSRGMSGEKRVIMSVLLGWFLAIIGMEFFIYLLDINNSPFLTEKFLFFNLPIHFWLTGQFLPLWFIILTALFNYWMDRHSKMALDRSIRFRVRQRRESEEKK